MFLHVVGLYLTYEGLKHLQPTTFTNPPIGLYLTYEGLKPKQLDFLFQTFFSLYLTYEGLKQNAGTTSG